MKPAETTSSLHPPAPAVVAEPIGVTYCTTHLHLRSKNTTTKGRKP